MALAVDLFDGETTSDLARARELAGRADGSYDQTVETLVSWIEWLRKDPRVDRKIGAVGWSISAGWALIASRIAALDATVLFYGTASLSAADLKGLKGPVQGHFGERDTDPHPAIVEAFKDAMKRAGATFDVRWSAANRPISCAQLSRWVPAFLTDRHKMFTRPPGAKLAAAGFT